MLGQNQAKLDSVIGSANYDLGHVFSTGGGGIAGLGVIAVTGQKAKGVTGLPAPVGDAFYVDYVAHEMGHQYGANHTFNGDSGSCAGGQRSAPHAFEIGSGSTIMSYAGICGNDNLQAHSDAMFHSDSIDAIRLEITQNPADAAAQKVNTANNIPTANAGSNFVIPDETPFELTAIGGDVDAGDTLTYSWEQRNLGPQQDVFAPDNGSSPLFRPWLPTTDPVRTFPRLSNLLTNTFPKGEKPALTNRTLTFRVVVRDNSLLSGGVASDDMTVTVVDTGVAGGFQMTNHNSTATWVGGTNKTINWTVAGTTAAPISAANVDILLSSDGGQTFDTVLASGVPNDGSHVITVPNIDTSQARIKIKGTGKIFFDINNANLNIDPAVGSVDVVETGGSTDVAEGGVTDTYTLALSTNPAGAVVVTATADSQSEISLNGTTWASSIPVNLADTSPVTVHVRAVDDLADEGTHTSTITHQVTSTGDPAKFPLGLVIASVSAEITDNDSCETEEVSIGNLNFGVAAADNAAGTGWLMYSVQSIHNRFKLLKDSSSGVGGGRSNTDPNNADHLVAVRFDSGKWQFTNKDTSGWLTFAPRATDRLLAEVDFSADTVNSLEGTDTTINGMSAGYFDGDLVFTPNIWNGAPNTGEFGVTGTHFDVQNCDPPARPVGLTPQTPSPEQTVGPKARFVQAESDVAARAQESPLDGDEVGQRRRLVEAGSHLANRQLGIPLTPAANQTVSDRARFVQPASRLPELDPVPPHVSQIVSERSRFIQPASDLAGRQPHDGNPFASDSVLDAAHARPPVAATNPNWLIDRAAAATVRETEPDLAEIRQTSLGWTFEQLAAAAFSNFDQLGVF
jgi:hypothetical protein